MGWKIKQKNKNGEKSLNMTFKFIDWSTIFSVISMLISWATHKSVGWAMFHFVCGTFYIIYWAITGDNANEAGLKEMFEYYKGLLK